MWVSAKNPFTGAFPRYVPVTDVFRTSTLVKSIPQVTANVKNTKACNRKTIPKIQVFLGLFIDIWVEIFVMKCYNHFNR